MFRKEETMMQNDSLMGRLRALVGGVEQGLCTRLS
jgi:hypothetical protein